MIRRIMSDGKNRRLVISLCVLLGAAILFSQLWCLARRGAPDFALLLAEVAAAAGILLIVLSYLRSVDYELEEAVDTLQRFLNGDSAARIECETEGERSRFYHSVNNLACALNAKLSGEKEQKEFLRDTISDISHQIRTPLAALSIYNGLLQNGAEDLAEVKAYADLSEMELDRIESLIQSLLKITKLDAGTLQMERRPENAAEMMRDVSLHFQIRAQQENKTIRLSGPDDLELNCDRDWMLEAFDNLVKNALDHTSGGDEISVTWSRPFGNRIRFTVSDNGCGIHEEDIHHIFKRFYRSRFSTDRQGLGLGLPLAKAIIEANGGAIAVESDPGNGTVFTLDFPNLTDL